MSDILKPDLCVIGAGTFGTALAIKASQHGLDVVLTGESSHGEEAPGADLQRAAFNASAARVHAIRTAGLVGLDTAAPKPNFKKIAEHSNAVAALAASRNESERLKALGITRLDGTPEFVDKQTLRCGTDMVRARQFVLATSAKPVIPALPGLDQVPYFTPASIGENIRKLTHLVVIGGTPVAFELAQAYCRLGSMVTVVPQGGMLTDFDPELVALLLRTLRQEGVHILEDAEVSAIVPRSQGIGVTLRSVTGQNSLDASHILVAMGNAAHLESALLDKAKLRKDRLHSERLLVGPDGQTSNGRISAIGAAAGHTQHHVVTRQISLLVERMLGHSKGRLDLRTMPKLVNTEPALAQCGLLHPVAPRSGLTIWRSNLAEDDAARADGEGYGVVKLVTGRKGSVAGAGAVGRNAADLMAVISVAMSRGVSVGDFADLALPAASCAAPLADLGHQFLMQQQPQRLSSLRRILR